MDLEPFRVSSPKQDPSPLPYLQQKESILLIFIEVAIPENKTPTVVSKSNFKHMYGP
jgi:fumarylacetoacetase